MAEAKARMQALFSGNTADASVSNDPLRYQAPREPSRSSQNHAQPAPAQPHATPQANNAVVFHTAVSMYQYDSATRKYVQKGTSASNAIGCVLVGSEVTYSVLFYTADKAPVCEVPMKAWKPTVQPKNYINFYDDKGSNWSVKFASEDALLEFMKQVFLVKIHVEIWSPTRSLDANALLKEELGASAIKTNANSEENGTPVGSGDTVGVEFKCWRVVGNAKAPPNDVVTKYPPFEKATDGDLRKFRIGDGSERIKALEEGVVGMKRGGKRMILAPPGKTNGQDWYLVEVTLVKTKSKSIRRSSGAPAAAAAAEPTPAAQAPRRERKSRAATSANNGNPNTSDIISYESEDPSAQASKDAMELERLRLRERARELELLQQQHNERVNMAAHNGGFTQAQAAPQSFPFSSVYGAAPSSSFSPYGSTFGPPQGVMTTSGRPVDGMIMELHAKIDYLIRMAPTSGSNATSSSFGGPVGATDVQSVLRGVERLAGENERLLLQINSQNQQYTSYEKRCEELLKHNQRLQDEKRLAEEKYQSMASLQLNYNAEISGLTSARDAAITQTNRLHGEYQQLLTAFYQKQQVSNESEEQRNALEFERQARVRLEKDLSKESQTRSLVEQELLLVKKQLDVFVKMKDSEIQSHRQEMEKQLHATRATQQQDVDDRVKKITAEYQQQEQRMQSEWQAQAERQQTQFQSQLAAFQAQNETLTSENRRLALELEAAVARKEELDASSSQATAMQLVEEEKRIYHEQIELLQQQVKELEAEQFARVQQDLDSGRLASPTSSPRSRKKLEITENEDEDAASAVSRAEHVLAAAKAKEEAAERTLAMAQEIKREAETMVANGATGGGGGEGAQGPAAREKTVSLFKEAVNEMFFRFQDVFEDEALAARSLESKQVLGVIRKVLKQSTKEVLQRLQEEEEETVAAPAALLPAPVATQAAVSVQEKPQETLQFAVPAVAVAAAAVTAAAAVAVASEDAGNDSDASNDEPPPPPELEDATREPEETPVESVVAVEEKSLAVEEHEGVSDHNDDEEEKDGEDEAEETEDDGADDLLFGAASTSAAAFPIEGFAVRRAPEDTEDESEDDFED